MTLRPLEPIALPLRSVALIYLAALFACLIAERLIGLPGLNLALT